MKTLIGRFAVEPFVALFLLSLSQGTFAQTRQDSLSYLDMRQSLQHHLDAYPLEMQEFKEGFDALSFSRKVEVLRVVKADLRDALKSFAELVESEKTGQISGSLGGGTTSQGKFWGLLGIQYGQMGSRTSVSGNITGEFYTRHKNLNEHFVVRLPQSIPGEIHALAELERTQIDYPESQISPESAFVVEAIRNHVEKYYANFLGIQFQVSRLHEQLVYALKYFDRCNLEDLKANPWAYQAVKEVKDWAESTKITLIPIEYYYVGLPNRNKNPTPKTSLDFSKLQKKSAWRPVELVTQNTTPTSYKHSFMGIEWGKIPEKVSTDRKLYLALDFHENSAPLIEVRHRTIDDSRQTIEQKLYDENGDEIQNPFRGVYDDIVKTGDGKLLYLEWQPFVERLFWQESPHLSESYFLY